MVNMFKTTSATTPGEYIAMLPDERRAEVERLDRLIRKTAPRLKPHIQSGMLAYGSFHYRSSSGREGDWFVIGLASQKRYLSLYVCATDGKRYLAESFRDRFPKADIGRSCIRFKRAEDLDPVALKALLRKGALFKGIAPEKVSRPAKR